MTDAEKTALLGRIDETLLYFEDEFPGDQEIWDSSLCEYTGGITPNDLMMMRAMVSAMPLSSFRKPV